MVAFLIELAKHNVTLEELEKALKGEHIKFIKYKAPPQGLFLKNVVFQGI